jgi:hypothetical protein
MTKTLVRLAVIIFFVSMCFLATGEYEDGDEGALIEPMIVNDKAPKLDVQPTTPKPTEVKKKAKKRKKFKGNWQFGDNERYEHLDKPISKKSSADQDKPSKDSKSKRKAPVSSEKSDNKKSKENMNKQPVSQNDANEMTQGIMGKVFGSIKK